MFRLTHRAGSCRSFHGYAGVVRRPIRRERRRTARRRTLLPTIAMEARVAGGLQHRRRGASRRVPRRPRPAYGKCRRARGIARAPARLRRRILRLQSLPARARHPREPDTSQRGRRPRRDVPPQGMLRAGEPPYRTNAESRRARHLGADARDGPRQRGLRRPRGAGKLRAVRRPSSAQRSPAHRRRRSATSSSHRSSSLGPSSAAVTRSSPPCHVPWSAPLAAPP
jgi:hypothetical protein